MLRQSADPRIATDKSDRARRQVLAQGGVPNARRFDGVNNAGAAHPNWKGGITPERQRERASARLVRWRTAVFQRDEYTCRSCGQVGGGLSAHHVKGWSDYPNLRYVLDNGVTLCTHCHLAVAHRGSWHNADGTNWLELARAINVG